MGFIKRLDLKTGFLCNNNCLFCVQAENKYKGNRSLADLKRDLEESKDRCDEVVLTGGEVTIRPDLIELVSYAKKLGYKTIQIQSNCRMLSNITFLKKLIAAGANEFSPALHGHTAELHDYLTRSPGSFSQTVKAIQNLKALGQEVITNTVVVKPNYRHVPEIAKLLVKLKVDQFQFAFVHAMGNAYKNIDSIVPNITLAAPYIHKGLQIGIDAGISVMAEAMPYCMMKGYEDYVAEKFIPESEVKTGISTVHDFKKVKITEGKAKFPQCRTCKYDNVCEGPWREYPEKFGIDEFIPVNDEKKRKHIEINIGKACNNRCVFCMDGSNTKREFISTENLKKELKKLSEEGYNSLGFLGGEPTIYPKLDEIVAYAKSLGFNEIHIISNGRKFSDKKFTAKLIKSGVTRVSVSIHSDSAKIEDKLTTVKGSFDEKIKGLKNLAELRKEGTLKQDISINIVVNKSNIDCLIEIIKYFSALGMKDFRLNFVRPEGYALENFDSVVPKYTEFTKQIPFLIENAKKTEVRVHFGDIPYCTVKDIGKAREFFSESKDYFNDMITITDEERKRSSWENIRKDELKTKPEFCNECKYNSICEGPWKEYLKRIGKNEFKTIRT